MSTLNPNSRLEAFCDGVFAIAITLLIIEIHVPPIHDIHSSADLWRALAHMWPSFFAFFLSFAIILISWVNHHAFLKFIDKTSTSFIYANGFLLLTYVVLPFASALLAEYGFTEYAAPAVAIYSFANLLQSVGWSLVGYSAYKGAGLARNEAAAKKVKETYTNGFYAMTICGVCTIAAFWFPLTVACVLAIIWAFWFILGFSLKAE